MYLIDTDILIYLLKGRETVKQQFDEHLRDPKAISLVSYAELYYGAEKSLHAEANLAKVRGFCDLFPILGISRVIIETFATLKAKLEGQGLRLDDLDLLIAATALVMGYTLVTNNERHFSRVPGLRLENWAR